MVRLVLLAVSLHLVLPIREAADEGVEHLRAAHAAVDAGLVVQLGAAQPALQPMSARGTLATDAVMDASFALYFFDASEHGKMFGVTPHGPGKDTGKPLLPASLFPQLPCMPLSDCVEWLFEVTKGAEKNGRRCVPSCNLNQHKYCVIPDEPLRRAARKFEDSGDPLDFIPTTEKWYVGGKACTGLWTKKNTRHGLRPVLVHALLARLPSHTPATSLSCTLISQEAYDRMQAAIRESPAAERLAKAYSGRFCIAAPFASAAESSGSSGDGDSADDECAEQAEGGCGGDGGDCPTRGDDEDWTWADYEDHDEYDDDDDDPEWDEDGPPTDSPRTCPAPRRVGLPLPDSYTKGEKSSWRKTDLDEKKARVRTMVDEVLVVHNDGSKKGFSLKKYADELILQRAFRQYS